MTEAWKLRLQPPDERALNRLPEKAAAACLEFMLGSLLRQPKVRGRRLVGEFEGLWSAHIGIHRVVYELDERSWTVHVYGIGHRARVYNAPPSR